MNVPETNLSHRGELQEKSRMHPTVLEQKRKNCYYDTGSFYTEQLEYKKKKKKTQFMPPDMPASRSSNAKLKATLTLPCRVAQMLTHGPWTLTMLLVGTLTHCLISSIGVDLTLHLIMLSYISLGCQGACFQFTLIEFFWQPNIA